MTAIERGRRRLVDGRTSGDAALKVPRVLGPWMQSMAQRYVFPMLSELVAAGVL